MFRVLLTSAALIMLFATPGRAESQSSLPYVDTEDGARYIFWDGIRYAGPFDVDDLVRVIGVFEHEVLYSVQHAGLITVYWADRSAGPFYGLHSAGVYGGMIGLAFRPSAAGGYFLMWGGQTAGPYDLIRNIRYVDGKVHAEVVVGSASTNIALDGGRL